MTSYNALQFQGWLKVQEIPVGIDRKTEKDQILYSSSTSIGTVTFYPNDIVELAIIHRESGENCFYLHFQAYDKDHAHELYEDFIDTLLNTSNTGERKILIVCSSALTSSYFAQELNKASSLLKLNYVFSACDHLVMYQKGFYYDAIMLTPQIHFEYPKARDTFRNQIVMKVPTKSYAKYNTLEVIRDLQDQFSKKEKAEQEDRYGILPASIKNEYRILVIGTINHRGVIRIGYRIYDRGKKTLDKEVIKADLTIQDLEDLLDYIFARHEDIKCVVLGLPGVEENGRLTCAGSCFNHSELASRFQTKYAHPFFLLNDVNAIALGFYALHPEHQDFLFYFQPQNEWVPGAGLIENGMLHKGFHHASGELMPLLTCVINDPESKIVTPEGMMEVVVKGLLSFICTSAPEYIVLYSQMTPDPMAIRKELSKYVSSEYIPHIEIVSRLKGYILLGLLNYGIQKINENEKSNG